jgi:ABC-type spermidine/putrescine transport system permease subunit II
MRPGVGVRVATLVLALFFIAPTVIIVATSFTSGLLVQFPPDGFSLDWYHEVLGDPRWTEALGNSLSVGLIAAVLATVVGTLLALGAARGRGIPASLITAVALMPLVVPLVIIAIGFYIVYVRIGLVGNVVGLGIAHAVLGLPFVFLNVLAQLRALDPRLEDAARICGAGGIRTFLLVTLPLISGGALVGALLAFISSWDEVVVAIFMTGPGFRTVPVEMFGQLREGVQPSTSAIASVVTLVSLLLLAGIAAASALRRARPWARFRRTP